MHVAYPFQRVLVKFIGSHRAAQIALARWREREGTRAAGRVRVAPGSANKSMAYWETDRRTTLTPTLSRQREREFLHNLFRGDDENGLAMVIADYEAKHWPIDPPDPVEVIKHQ